MGVPSSAASYAAGQDLAPAALRSAGLLEQLIASGLEVHDDGDLPHQAWSPDRDHPLAQNAGQAIMSVRQLADRLYPLLARGDTALVLGGNCTIALGVVAAVFVAAIASFARERKDPLALVPVGAVEAIDHLHLPDRVMNTYYWGGYLEWVWRGRRKVFIDGRNQYFANGTFDDAHSLEQLAAWSDVLDTYETRTVLWLRHSPLDQALSADPRWAIVYSDAMAVVYVRR